MALPIASIRRALRDPDSLARLQGTVFVTSGLWPVVNIRTFEAITGPKHDRWLVKTVGLMAGVIGTDLLLAARDGRGDERRWLGTGSALTFAAIDLWYVARGRISPVYLLDAAMELTFVASWAATRGDPEPAGPAHVQAG